MSRNPGVSTRPPPSASAWGGTRGIRWSPPPVGSFPEEDGSTNNDEIKEK